MEGNVVHAAWVLGGAIVLSSIIAGGGAMLGAERASNRTAEAIARGPTNTRVILAEPVQVALPTLMKVGFEPQLPVAVKVENAMNTNTGQRAAFELQLGK